MKALLIAASLLAAAELSGALAPATGGRLTDYFNWFDGFAATAENTVPFQPPLAPAAGAIDNPDRTWSGWWPEEYAAQLEPLTNPGFYSQLFVEVVFLAETSARSNDWGYSLNDVRYLLTEGVEAGTPDANLVFGDYAIFRVQPGDTLDFWFSTMPTPGAPGAEFPGVPPAVFYALGDYRNLPPWATSQGHYGTVTPLTSVRYPGGWEADSRDTPFVVVAFEEALPGENGARDFTDLAFAYRAWYETPCCHPVPEPGSYGLLAAGVLLAFVGRRKLKPSRRSRVQEAP